MATSRLSLLAMKDDGGKKKSKAERKAAKTASPSTQYGRYSGVIGKDGKPIDRPTLKQSMETMTDYMKTNKSELTDHFDGPSNIYHPQFQHHSINIDKKKKQTNA